MGWFRDKIKNWLGVNNMGSLPKQYDNRLWFINDDEKIRKQKLREYLIWYSGDSDELLNYYTQGNFREFNTEPIFNRNKKEYFWGISSQETSIKRTHSGIPRAIVETLVNAIGTPIFTSDDPMMRSGLALAGANKYWKKTAENLTTDDGILTASEISNLDLSACQLVVLSACETGLGAINGSEGVFGLQRAFKMAGVKSIIMSLWKVPDTQTAELFDIFYSECFAGKTIHEAFHSAQAKMKTKYSPYYWAGFVLLE
jgi:hypothetical protein